MAKVHHVKHRKPKYPPTTWHQKGVYKTKTHAVNARNRTSGKHLRIVKKNKKFYLYNLTYKSL